MTMIFHIQAKFYVEYKVIIDGLIISPMTQINIWEVQVKGIGFNHYKNGENS